MNDRKMHPLISIITVSYNAEEYIEQCIQSVLSQDFDGFEYIIIDGVGIQNQTAVYLMLLIKAWSRQRVSG